ncbi:MAG: carboxylating nicotinate-nucleotide diphosphorylase [Candidatus Gastranaerophilales bacterium]|nr:carboxylating nicotinate-nucleotide diphosphorylase [Candidatus Gastranaerophilales bacterium]
MVSLDTLQVRKLIRQALAEDIGTGDLTTNALISPEQQLSAIYNTREDGIIAGLPILSLIFRELDPQINVKLLVNDGDRIEKGQQLAVVSGNARAILTGERLSLNFIQKMSAIATLTDKFQQAIRPYKAVICDTRKSCPNFRIFEKYSVGIGGGKPHRMGLYDAVMIKDNHICAAGSIEKAVKAARKAVPHAITIEVETENIAQVQEALFADADIIMLDNMPVAMMKEAVQLINGRAITEASGTVSLENVNVIASTGVDYISTSAITAKAGILDIGLDM